jgi:ankyrin repeat protein
LIAGKADNLGLYLDLLTKCDKPLQSKVLTSENKDGFTPLHSALKEGNPDNVSLYLDLLRCRDKALQATVLTSATKYGFTPLHSALKEGSPENVRLYLDLLKECDKSLQTQVLTSANKAGFTPLHEALIAGNAANLELYLNLIVSLLQQEKLKELLCAKNSSGYTSMHQALDSKNAIKISSILLEFVKSNFCDSDANEIIQHLLYTRIKNYLPSANRKAHGNELANEINTYLRDLRREYPEIDGYTDTNISQSYNGGGKIPPSHDNYIPSSNRIVSYAGDRYSDRSSSANTHRSQSSNGGGNSRRYDNYRRLSSHSAYASGPHQARSGEYSYNNHGNRSSFFRSTPQVGLGSGHAPRSQNYDDGKRSRDDYNRYTHDDRRNKPYRR